MKKFGLNVAAVLAFGALTSCGGGWTSALSGTNWVSMTTVPQATANGVTATDWVIHFAASTNITPASTGGTASGTYTATYNETYGTAAGSVLPGCHVAATCTGGWSETGVLPVTGSNTAMGQVDSTTETCTCVSTMCAAGTTGITGACQSYADSGGEENYNIASGNLNLTAGDSLAPYYGTGANYVFMTTTSATSTM